MFATWNLLAQACHPESNTATRRRRALLRDLPLGALHLLDFGKCETKNYPCQSFSRKRLRHGDSSMRVFVLEFCAYRSE